MPTNQVITDDFDEPLTDPDGVLEPVTVVATTEAAVGLEAVAALVSFATAEGLQQVPVLETVDDVNSAPANRSILSVPSSPVISPSIPPLILSNCFSSSSAAGCSCC